MKNHHDNGRVRTRLTETKEGNVSSLQLQDNRFLQFMKCVHQDMNLNVMTGVRGRRRQGDEGEKDAVDTGDLRRNAKLIKGRIN